MLARVCEFSGAVLGKSGAIPGKYLQFRCHPWEVQGSTMGNILGQGSLVGNKRLIVERINRCNFVFSFNFNRLMDRLRISVPSRYTGISVHA